jgi:aminoglycoside 6'-N-acetyltransferase I
VPCRASIRQEDGSDGARKIVDMTGLKIREAQSGDEVKLAAMMALLWPDGTVEEYRREAAAVVRSGMSGTLPGVIFLATDESEKPAGFLHAGLRSHADGCDISRPVGFIEGWFVRAESRRQGIGSALMRAAEVWARAQGCLEIGSDALIENEESQSAHDALGFEVVDRCVHFRKNL